MKKQVVSIEALFQKHENSWKSSYPLFRAVIENKGLEVGAEIGVAFGGHAETLLGSPSLKKLYCIDPYKHQQGYDDPLNLPQKNFDELCEFMRKRLSVFGDRFSHIREESNIAADQIPEPLDFVYIDADHSYEGVWNDLCTWALKVKEQGIMGGHDYEHVDFPGVKKAIDRFFSRFGWEVHHEGEGVWWVQKESLPISFFIPAYNCADTITESVASIYNDNFQAGDEIVIVNDGSTDDTASVLAQLQKEHPEIRVVNHIRNKGGSAARNTAVENAGHDLLFCLDSDNLLEKNSVPKLKDYLLETGADAAGFQELRLFEKDFSKEDQTRKWIFKSGQTTFADVMASTHVLCASGNYLYTKQSWERADGYPEFAGAYDAWGFGCRQVATDSIMMVMSNSYYYHRVGHESYMVRHSKKLNASLSVLQIIIPFLDMIHPDDVNYIMGSKGRLTWYENLEKRPLHTTLGKIGSGGVSTLPKGDSSFKAMLYRIYLAIRKAFSIG